MDIAFQRKLDRLLGIPVCWMLSLFSRRTRFESLKPKTILVIILSEMGSLVLARPMFERIKEKYPEASIFVLVFERNREFLEVLNVVPISNTLTIRDTSIKDFIVDSFKVLCKVRQNRIDTVVDCELFSRISSIYSFLSGARLRAGFHPHTQEGLFRGDFINRRVLYNPYCHIADQFITLVEALESSQVPTVKRRLVGTRHRIPPMDVKPGEIADMRKRLETDFPGIAGKRLVLIYAGGGLLPIRAWPLEYFCQVAADLIRKGYGVAMIGLQGDRQTAEVIVSQCQSRACINLCGYTRTVRELMVLFHIALLLITNDGGPGHFAVMTPIRSIILYGPETPILYGPLDTKTVTLYARCSCSPCLTAYNHRNSPCDGDNVCLKMISPKEALTKAYELLEGQKAVSVERSLLD